MSREIQSRGRLRPGALGRSRSAGRRVPASVAQGRRVAGRRCLVCGRRPVDPAHLVPRRLGGCDSPDCVVALCRTHHRLYDTARLALAPYLGDGQRGELRHALTHVTGGELRLALAGAGWPAPWQLPDNQTTENGVRS